MSSWIHDHRSNGNMLITAMMLTFNVQFVLQQDLFAVKFVGTVANWKESF